MLVYASEDPQAPQHSVRKCEEEYNDYWHGLELLIYGLSRFLSFGCHLRHGHNQCYNTAQDGMYGTLHTLSVVARAAYKP